MAIKTVDASNQGLNEVNFLGLTEAVRENILRALVGNLKTAAWAYHTHRRTSTNSDNERVTLYEFKPINSQKQETISFNDGYTVFQDSDDLNILATDNGIWVKIYPGRGRYTEELDTGDIDYDFCVYLTLCYYEPNADGSNVIEPWHKVSVGDNGEVYIDEENGEPDEPNFERYALANGGISKYLTICNSGTDASGNDGRNVNVVAAVNAAMKQEIKFNSSTGAWSRKYPYFALFTHPTEGRIIAWGKLTDEIEVKQADVVPMFREGKFRLFFPAPNEVERQINAEFDDLEN